MSKFISGLLAEAQAISSKEFDPDTEVKQGEEVIGEVPADLRPLWRLRRKEIASQKARSSDVMRLLADMMDSVDKGKPEDAKPVMAKLEGFKNRGKTIDQLFWGSLYSQVPESSVVPGVGIRKGWKVVAVPEEQDVEVIPISVPASVIQTIKNMADNCQCPNCQKRRREKASQSQ